MFVSVVVPVYNAERYVREAIESVLTQTHRNFELILADDGSRDRSLQILREYEEKDPRIRVISHENWGMGRTLNHAVELAQSDWIARFDPDDVMEPERLERQIAFIHEHPSLSVCASLVTYIDEHGNALGRSQSELTDYDSVPEMRSRDELIPMHHPAVLMRRRVFLEIGGYRPQFWPCDDLDLWTRIADRGHRILVQQEYLVRYRIHGGSATVQEAREATTQVAWLVQCSRNRRQGLPEPSFEEFLAVRRSRSLLRRLNEDRLSIANVLYKKATFEYSLGHLGRTALLVAGSSILDPTYAPRRVWHKTLRPKLFSPNARKRRVA